MGLIKKILQLLRPFQKRQAVILLVMAFVGMLMEMVGLGLIVPILVLMTEPEPINKYPLIKPLIDYFGNPSQANMVMGAMLVFVVFATTKAIFMSLLTWWKDSYVVDIRIYFSQKLFHDYLYRPYTFHLRRNSAMLIRNVNSDVSFFVKGISALMDIVTDGLILAGLLTLLVWTEPVGALSMAVFLGVAGSLGYHATKSRMSRWGKLARVHNGERIKHIQQGLGGAKEIELLGRQEGVLREFDLHNTSLARIDKLQKIVSSLPRFWFELLISIGLTGLVIGMLSAGKSPGELIPILGLFAVAALRFMPSMVRMFAAVQNLKYYQPSIENLHKEFLEISDSIEKRELKPSRDGSNDLLMQWKTIEFQGLSYAYPATNNQIVLKNINLSIHRNSSIGFIGGSGAGKSTLIDILLGLLIDAKGELLIDGENINTFLREWQDQIGYVPQTIYLTDDTIRRNIAFGLAENEIDDVAVQNAIRAAQLEEFIEGLEESVHTKVGEHGVRLSGGQRQRIGIARALYHNPSVLVLDEATSALDTATETRVMASVDELKGSKTIIIVAHRLSTVANCDWLYRMENGEIVSQGNYDDVVREQ
jgi:ATP-binding cassette, subfamily B, bacterial PglK